ncbi:S10 family peptidase [Mucilaginibacter agri]|uniref:Peptidase S10 n=1 Tax=Mucilaginibacter agri TaxID=2695265 RepID=A0A965ZF39_9SPHI|nr:hypothetical protein [Mucilaginibacter agri]NCD69750.1 hypothetical protein [Mucilaginibacter agri]
MPLPRKRFTSILYPNASIFAVFVLLLFSSWAKIPSHIPLHDLTESLAFKKAVGLHSLRLDGAVVNYQSTAGYVNVEDSQHRKAQIFYTDYLVRRANRPVTFVFNGGPGSSSIWLHMGSFGPVRAVPGKNGYQNNPNTWLGFTDLVFIDPVGTGFSRASNSADEKCFYGYQEDVEIIGQFIKKYLTDNNRQNSPLFLAGESYGAARAVGLTAYIRTAFKIPVKGLTLISPALNYKLVTFRKRNDAPYPYYLPTYAATAQYHNQLTPELQQITPEQLSKKVTAFAFGTYRNALTGLNVLPANVIDTLSYFTGIDTGTLRRLNGRVTDVQFSRLILKKKGEVTGTYDSRATGKASAVADPSEVALRAVFPQAFQQYQQNELHYKTPLAYLATIATPNWNYGPAKAAGGYLDVVPVLRKLLSGDTDLKVHIVSGDYDLATPSSTVNLYANQIRSHSVSVHRYLSGHMLYTDSQANAKWYEDTKGFYQMAL